MDLFSYSQASLAHLERMLNWLLADILIPVNLVQIPAVALSGGIAWLMARPLRHVHRRLRLFVSLPIASASAGRVLRLLGFFAEKWRLASRAVVKLASGLTQAPHEVVVIFVAADPSRNVLLHLLIPLVVFPAVKPGGKFCAVFKRASATGSEREPARIAA